MLEKLKNLDINTDENLSSLIKDYEAFFRDYNEKVNLVGKNDSSLLFEKHIYDSLSFNLFVKKHNISLSSKIIDIGTGGGFPSVPLSFIYKNSEIYAVDSIGKKINFILQVKEKYNLTGLKPVCSRFENLPVSYKNRFDVAVSRAVAELPVILEYSIPYVKNGGYFVAYKSVKASEEIKLASNALKVLKTSLIDTIEYNLPLDGINKRVLLIFKKNGEIKGDFPRKNGLPKKMPL